MKQFFSHPSFNKKEGRFLFKKGPETNETRVESTTAERNSLAEQVVNENLQILGNRVDTAINVPKNEETMTASAEKEKPTKADFGDNVEMPARDQIVLAEEGENTSEFIATLEEQATKQLGLSTNSFPAGLEYVETLVS